MKSKALLVSLIFAAMFPAVSAVAQDQRNSKSEVSGPATRIEDQAGALSGPDWKTIMVELEPGAIESWQSRQEGELLYVLEGLGRLEAGAGSSISLRPGTVARLEARPRHLVKNTSAVRSLKLLIVFPAAHGQGHPLLAARHIQGAGHEPITAPPKDLHSLKQGSERQQTSGPEAIGLVF